MGPCRLLRSVAGGWLKVLWRWKPAKGVPYHRPMLGADQLLSELYGSSRGGGLGCSPLTDGVHLSYKRADCVRPLDSLPLSALNIQYYVNSTVHIYILYPKILYEDSVSILCTLYTFCTLVITLYKRCPLCAGTCAAEAKAVSSESAPNAPGE